jgi:hypothetical protein
MTAILQAELDAIAANKAQLDIIQARIQQIRATAESLHDESRTQIEDIGNKAAAVYSLLFMRYEYCDEHHLFGKKEAQENARCIAATLALFSAEPGVKREQALAEFFSISSELMSSSKKKQYLGVAMLALGVALVGTAIALGICLLVGAWPCVPVVISMGILAPLVFSIPSAQAMTAALIGGLALVIGLPTLCTGAGVYKEARKEKEAHKASHGEQIGKAMGELHSSFFKPTSAEGQQEITELAILTGSSTAHV